MKKTFLLMIVLLALIPCLPHSVPARTWLIPSELTSIQAGIDSSTSGDTVLVASGIYIENLDFKGKAIAVVGRDPQHTILDGSSGNWSCVQFISGEPRAAVLTGFTITGGVGTESAPGEAPAGGGVYIRESEPSIIGNIIEGNSTIGWGGGIYCENNSWNTKWSPLIQQNVIRNNTAGGNGGGLGARNSVSPVILENEISYNQVEGGDGGGMWLALTEDGAVISHNSIIHNIANDHGGGIYGGLATNLRPPLELLVSWNLVAGNYAHADGNTGDSGGGIWLWETNALVQHNTIVSNTGEGQNDSNGGGIVLGYPGTPVIELNIIALNTKGGGIWCGRGVAPIIRNNLAWQNVGGEGVNDCPDWWQSNGNVIDNPYFCDPASGDYQVASNSGVMTHPAGPLGAFPSPGCGPVSIQLSTWGSLKARYR